MTDSPCAVYFHPDVRPSLGDEFDRVMARLARDASALREDRRLKRLKGRHYHGAHRLKVGSARVALSFRGRGKDAPPEVWVHLADARREIYSRDALHARSREWADAASDTELLACLEYSVWTDPGDSGGSGADEAVIEPLPVLSPEQAEFCRVLLPFDSEHHDPNAVVFLGHGPPGSGKTVVAADSASDAWEFLGYEVIILVPSGKLQREYRDHLRKRAALSEVPPTEADPTGKPGLWVYVAHEFFASLAARAPTPRAELNAWWTKLLNSGQLASWANRNPEARHPRFLTLLSAVWGDPEMAPSVAKDALNISDAAHHALLADLRSDKSRAKFVDAERQKAGIVLWWESSALAERRIADLRPGRNLLILADEAQDLVPAQWRSLVRSAHDADAAHGGSLRPPGGQVAWGRRRRSPEGGRARATRRADDHSRVAGGPADLPR